jgi:hypothetical protein
VDARGGDRAGGGGWGRRRVLGAVSERASAGEGREGWQGLWDIVVLS